MSERDNDFDDLVDGGDAFADADETDGAGKTPEPKDEGADDGKDDKASGANKGKTPEEGDEDDDDEGDKDPKDGADADKDGKDADADKDASKDKMVPKKALDSEKRRRRELAARLKRIEDRLGAEDAEVARRSIPDPKTHPAEHAAYVQQQATVVQINDKLNFSEYHARKTHGDDVVTEAFDWANEQIEKDPEFAKTLFAHADPYDYAVELHKKSLEKSDGGGVADPDYEAFKAWQASQKTGEGEAPAKQEPKDEKAKRPQSLAQRSSASGPSSGVNSAAEDPFDSEFSR